MVSIYNCMYINGLDYLLALWYVSSTLFVVSYAEDKLLIIWDQYTSSFIHPLCLYIVIFTSCN